MSKAQSSIEKFDSSKISVEKKGGIIHQKKDEENVKDLLFEIADLKQQLQNANDLIQKVMKSENNEQGSALFELPRANSEKLTTCIQT